MDFNSFCFFPPPHSNIPSVSSLWNHCHTTNCSKIRADPSFINALRRFFTAAFKTFLQTAAFQKTTLLVPKLLVYPIRQGIWMSVMRTQHESVMKAITHCQERWAPQHALATLGVLFILSYVWRKGIKWKSRWKKKKNWLTEGGNRQLAASFGSGGCQYAGEMIEIGSGLKKEGADLCLKRPSSI